MKKLSAFVFWMILAPVFLVTCGPATQEPRTARVSEIQNIVQARPAASAEFAGISNGHVVRSGGQVRTQDQARARLEFNDGSIVRMAPNALLTIEDITEGANALSRLQLSVGKVWLSLLGRTTQIRTPVGVASGRDSFATIDFSTDTGTFKCLQGTCQLKNDTVDVTLNNLEGAALKSGESGWKRVEVTQADVAEFVANNPGSVLSPTRTTTPSQTPTRANTPTPTRALTHTPTLTLTPTRPPVPTATPPPGMRKLESAQIELWVPNSFVGGEPIKEKDAILKVLRAWGSEYASGFKVIEQNPTAFAIYAIDSQLGSSGLVTTISITVNQIVSTSAGDTLQGGIKLQLPLQYGVLDRRNVGLAYYAAERMVADSIYQGIRTRQLVYTIKSQNTAWVVLYSTTEDEFFARLPAFEQSVLSLRFKP
jgi:hypothetical protein